ncbi:MAG: hypothetical protein KBC12_00330 [Candidatus Pacebacteria bacterium]|nr:hypothetical protein [Candidatus Paceibacterota bacterium]MBP9851099.1 hypothetical protein [Candidatus Paceibacterota bacterium]
MITFPKKWFFLSAVLLFIVVPVLFVLAFITEVKTLPESNIGQTEVTLNGRITASGNIPVLGHFRYTKTATASCINMQNETNTPDQTLVNNSGTYLFSHNLTGLQSGTTYYYCAIGTQGGVSQFGNVESFITNTNGGGNNGGPSFGGGFGSGSSNSSVTTTSLQKQFSGIIIKLKAKEIEALENANYACAVPGTSIEIRPKGMKGFQQTSYIIPAATISKTKHAPSVNQQIVGKYSGKTSVTCIFQGEPPLEETVTLNTIKMYGNSAQ